MFPLNVAAAAAGVPSGPRVQLLTAGSSLMDFQISDNSPVTTEVRWTVDSDGNFYTKSGQVGSTINRYPWLLKGLNADYEVIFNVNTITGNGNGQVFGTIDTWLGLGTDKTFRFSMTSSPFSFDASNLNATMSIRDASTLAVLASRVMTGNLTTEV